MPQRSKSNETEASNKGNPSGKGKSQASIKNIKDVKDKEELERKEEIREKYTDENNDPDPDAVHVTNPNRNTDKPEIDKPAYGSS